MFSWTNIGDKIFKSNLAVLFLHIFLMNCESWHSLVDTIFGGALIINTCQSAIVIALYEHHNLTFISYTMQLNFISWSSVFCVNSFSFYAGPWWLLENDAQIHRSRCYVIGDTSGYHIWTNDHASENGRGLWFFYPQALWKFPLCGIINFFPMLIRALSGKLLLYWKVLYGFQAIQWRHDMTWVADYLNRYLSWVIGFQVLILLVFRN